MNTLLYALLAPGERVTLPLVLLLVPAPPPALPEAHPVRMGVQAPVAALWQEIPQRPLLGIEVLERVHRPGLTGATLVGRLVDAGTDQPISDATVTVGRKSALTGSDGGFRIEGLEASDIVVTIEHVAYGKQSAPMKVVGGTEYHIRASVTPRAIPIDSLEVTTRNNTEARVEARRRASPTRLDIVAGSELEAARVRGETVGQVVSRFPGLMVSYGRFITPDGPSVGVCVESFTRRTPRLIDAQAPPMRLPEGFQPCDPLPLFVDDAYIDDPVGFLHNLNLYEVEEVEVLPEIMAGARYGLLAGNGGVLLIKTRRR